MDPAKDQTDQPTATPDNQGVVPSVPPPAGGIAKEVEPLSNDSINPSEKGPEISAELAEIGAKEASQVPQSTQEHTEVGIRVSQSTPEPVITSAPASFKSPLTQAEMVTAKRSRITDAIAWLANTIARQIKRSKFNERESFPKSI